MPLKEKEKCLIKMRTGNYSEISHFLEDIFYREKNLAKYAYEILRLIYDRKEFGLLAKNWKEHISNMFSLVPVTKDESAELDRIYSKYKDTMNLTEKKPYLSILRNSEQQSIAIDPKEKELLNRAVRWNSAVSSYYSITNKLVAVGLVDKKEGRYFKSKKMLDQFKQIEKTLSDFEIKIRS